MAIMQFFNTKEIEEFATSLASFAAEPLPTSLGATRAILDILNEADAQNAAGRHAEALALVQSGLAIAPEDLRLWSALGSTLYEWGRHRDALDAFMNVANL